MQKDGWLTARQHALWPTRDLRSLPTFSLLRSITVGGAHNLECTQVGDLVVGGHDTSIQLRGVRIVPGFGANILSVPYLEKELGMTQSSNGTHWWAKKAGKVILQGQADDAGLSWVTLTRMKAGMKNDRPSAQRPPKKPRKSGNSPKRTLKTSNCVKPDKFGWSEQIQNGVSEEFGHHNTIDTSLRPPDSESESSWSDNEALGHFKPVNMREVSKDLAFLSKQHAADLGLAHLRWGHRSFRRCADILGIPAPAKVPFCVACVEAKATRHGRRSRVERESPVREPASRPGFRLFFDPVGPFREPTLHRFRYALVVLDDFSGLVHTKLMAKLVKRIEAEKGSKRVVAQIGSDSFPAFVEGRNMLEFAASRGILLIASPPYTQKLNPVEGIIKILIRMALAMLRHAGAPKSLIEYSMSHATLLLNRLPRQKKGSGLVVALNLWLGLEPPSILHKLKVWGCAAYALVMGNMSKFDSKVTRQVHLGYDVARSAYILCSLPHFKISYSAHVTFNEDDFPMRGSLNRTQSLFDFLKKPQDLC